MDKLKLQKLLEGLATPEAQEAYNFLKLKCKWPKVGEVDGKIDKDAPALQFMHWVGSVLLEADSIARLFTQRDFKLTEVISTLHKDADYLRKPIQFAEDLLPALNQDKCAEIKAAVGELKEFQNRLREAVADLVHESKHERGHG